MTQKLTLITTLLLAIAVPSQAIDLTEEPLEDSLAIAIVRENIISQGITACKAGKYQKTIQLLKTFLNPKRIVATSLEKEGFNCLALAYQNVGEEVRATETIVRAILFFENSPIELANFENTAGIIAYQQNRKILANKHWQKARQLYLANDFAKGWAKTTLNLAKSYQELGYVKKSQQLLRELRETPFKLEGFPN